MIPPVISKQPGFAYHIDCMGILSLQSTAWKKLTEELQMNQFKNKIPMIAGILFLIANVTAVVSA